MINDEINGWGILKLVHALRDTGIQVSLQEIQDVVTALELFPNLDDKIIVQSIFIHRTEDIAHFNLIWKLIFEDFKIEFNSDDLVNGIRCSCIGTQENKDSDLGQGLGTGNGRVTLYPGSNKNQKPFDELFRMPDVKLLSQLKGFPGGIDEINDPGKLDFEEEVKFILGQSGFLSWSNSQELDYTRGKISEEDWQIFCEKKELFEQNIRHQLWHLRIEKENSWDYLKKVNWRYKSLDQFTTQEEHAIHQALRQIGKKLATRPGWRKKKACRGQIRLSSVLKEMVRGNGLIHRLEFEQPILQKPELIVLCDISNSVAPFSQFLLYLIRRIKTRFRKVRIYLFIDTLWDISRENWFEESDSIEQIKSWTHKNSSGFTNYGNVFQEFYQNYLPETSTQATFLILGDARNNYRPSHVEYLIGIREKVRRVYWLNPLSENEWRNSDNIMGDYLPYCTKAFRCRTIEDLWRIAREVF